MAARSIEEQIEDVVKKQIKCKYYTKTENINAEIDNALKSAPSKSGGNGANYPDIKLLIKTKSLRYIPVMIEVKGKRGDLVKLNSDGDVDNKTKEGTPNFATIRKYAVNGAVHYATAIVNLTQSYKEAIAIGVNGYYEGDQLIFELAVYYISQDNYCIPKEVGIERYEEVVNLVLYGRQYLHYLTDSEFIEDTISLNGDDWTFEQHVNVNTVPNENDFRLVLKEYMGWKVSIDLPASVASYDLDVYGLSPDERDALQHYRDNSVPTKEFLAGQLFTVIGNPQLNKDSFHFVDKKEGTYPYFTRTVTNNGIAGYVEYLDEEHKIKGNSLAVGMLGMQFFYMEGDFYSGQFTKTLFPTFQGFDETIAKFFITWLNKNSLVYKSVLVRDFEKELKQTKLKIPVKSDGSIDFTFIRNFIRAQETIIIKDVELFWNSKVQSMRELI